MKKDVVQFEMMTDDDGETSPLMQDRRYPYICYFKEAYLGREDENFKPDTHYATIMVAIPNGYKLATEVERRRLPEGTMFFNGQSWSFSNSRRIGKEGHRNTTYITPIEPTEDLALTEAKELVAKAQADLDKATKRLNSINKGE